MISSNSVDETEVTHVFEYSGQPVAIGQFDEIVYPDTPLWIVDLQDPSLKLRPGFSRDISTPSMVFCRRKDVFEKSEESPLNDLFKSSRTTITSRGAKLEVENNTKFLAPIRIGTILEAKMAIQERHPWMKDDIEDPRVQTYVDDLQRQLSAQRNSKVWVFDLGDEALFNDFYGLPPACFRNTPKTPEEKALFKNSLGVTSARFRDTPRTMGEDYFLALDSYAVLVRSAALWHGIETTPYDEKDPADRVARTFGFLEDFYEKTGEAVKLINELSEEALGRKVVDTTDNPLIEVFTSARSGEGSWSCNFRLGGTTQLIYISDPSWFSTSMPEEIAFKAWIHEIIHSGQPKPFDFRELLTETVAKIITAQLTPGESVLTMKRDELDIFLENIKSGYDYGVSSARFMSQVKQPGAVDLFMQVTSLMQKAENGELVCDGKYLSLRDVLCALIRSCFTGNIHRKRRGQELTTNGKGRGSSDRGGDQDNIYAFEPHIGDLLETEGLRFMNRYKDALDRSFYCVPRGIRYV